MFIPRLLVFSLLISFCIAPVAAQSSSDRGTVASQAQLDGLIAPPEFRAHGLPLASNVHAKIRDIHPQLSFDPEPMQNDTDCYTMRSYRVTRDDSQSDAVRLAGYSECQLAARFQMKTAVDSREVGPR